MRIFALAFLFGLTRMSPTPQNRRGIQAFFACSLVFWLFGLGLTNQVQASCGDYLKHSASMRQMDSVDFSTNGVGDSPVPACGCKNGSCKSAPPSLPTEPTRLLVLRKQLNPLAISICVNGDSPRGILLTSNEFMPAQPSLDTLVPPPRVAAI